MSDTRLEPTVRVRTTTPAAIETELLVVPVFETDDLSDVAGLDQASGGEIERARAAGEFRGKVGDVFVTPLTEGKWHARRVALVGVGAPVDDVSSRMRRAAATVAIESRRRHIAQVAFVVREQASAAELGQALAEGLLLGNFEDRRYRTDDDGVTPPIQSCEILTTLADQTVVTPAVEKGVVLATSANVARELSNQPANLLTPSMFADRAREQVEPQGVQVEVLEEDEIRALGMGLLLGVARGSVEPPRLLVMRHTPNDAPESPTLGLVGKGVTFDTGGISIKSADSMDLMKHDMAGGAAVVGALRAIGALGLGVRVVGIVPMTENMPGSRAVKPGDVLTSASGKTVEVLNTDAEGRLILADALWYACELGATHLVDVATLTGAVVVALGKVSSGLFGSPNSWLEQVQAASRRTGERVWPMPLFEEYREQLRSEMADLANIGGRPAGACTAASFLQAFSGDRAWAHLDVAGTAWLEDARPDQAKGATGVMVRTLAELASSSSAWAVTR